MSYALAIGLSLIAGAAIGVLTYQRSSRHFERERFIRGYVFSHALLESLPKTYPLLREKDLFLVARALRQYFLIHLRARGEAVAMPSKVVDTLWHEFILDTRSYHAFCERAFGGYFHHVPASKMRPGTSSSAAMRKAWHLACLEENIAPKAATRLPLLFAIDAKLGIPGGNTYSLSRPAKPANGCSGGGCGGYACSGDGLAGGGSAGSGCSGGGDGGSCGGGGCGGD